MTLTMLGTGNAAATRCYNTCFALRFGEEFFLTDAGGGNGILSQLQQANIPLSQIHSLFITHAHTDHILGAVWVVRMIAQMMNAGKYCGKLHIFGHDEAIETLEWICRRTLPSNVCIHFGTDILFSQLTDGEAFSVPGMRGIAFDIGSTKTKQFGYCLNLPDGQRLVCLGDEPFAERTRKHVSGADWLLCEAFCLYADRDRFHPYEKHHSTAGDAGRLADELKVKNLLLYHTEDETLPTRKSAYTAEAALYFHGHIVVPDDLELVHLSQK